jgi:hypothetical protein
MLGVYERYGVLIGDADLERPRRDLAIDLEVELSRAPNLDLERGLDLRLSTREISRSS